jgi:hypothetical protein
MTERTAPRNRGLGRAWPHGSRVSVRQIVHEGKPDKSLRGRYPLSGVVWAIVGSIPLPLPAADCRHGPKRVGWSHTRACCRGLASDTRSVLQGRARDDTEETISALRERWLIAEHAHAMEGRLVHTGLVLVRAENRPIYEKPRTPARRRGKYTPAAPTSGGRAIAIVADRAERTVSGLCSTLAARSLVAFRGARPAAMYGSSS